MKSSIRDGLRETITLDTGGWVRAWAFRIWKQAYTITNGVCIPFRLKHNSMKKKL